MLDESKGQPKALKVFLCHSSGDKPQVRILYKRLIGDGFVPWLDERDLLPGQDWEAEIKRAVRETDVVVCLSHASIGKTGFVQRELKYALDVADSQPEETIFMIPVRLDDCNVPARLKGWQWADLFSEDGYERLALALNKRATEIGARVPVRSSLFGVWFGVSGRLLLSAGDRDGAVSGCYDWNQYPMVGHMEGFVEGRVLKFQWSWDKTRDHGNGYLILNNESTRLDGGWFYYEDAVDLEAAAGSDEDARVPIHPWSFSRELSPDSVAIEIAGGPRPLPR